VGRLRPRSRTGRAALLLVMGRSAAALHSLHTLRRCPQRQGDCGGGSRSLPRGGYSGYVAAARIPVERVNGPVLLLPASKDEVWPSLDTSRNIHATFVRAHRGRLVELGEYEEAGHNICGTGASPERKDGIISNPQDASISRSPAGLGGRCRTTRFRETQTRRHFTP
jgi:hypothetical protein